MYNRIIHGALRLSTRLCNDRKCLKNNLIYFYKAPEMLLKARIYSRGKEIQLTSNAAAWFSTIFKTDWQDEFLTVQSSQTCTILSLQLTLCQCRYIKRGETKIRVLEKRNIRTSDYVPVQVVERVHKNIEESVRIEDQYNTAHVFM